MKLGSINQETKDRSVRLVTLKPGKHFTVPTTHERNMCLYAAKTLFAAGVINFEIMTAKSRDGSGFDVIRLPYQKTNNKEKGK